MRSPWAWLAASAVCAFASFFFLYSDAYWWLTGVSFCSLAVGAGLVLKER